MGIGTFGSFTQARLAIYAAQSGLSVTGNNIANINTPGYTRQKLDQTSFYAGGSDRYYSQNDMRIGNGVLCTGVSQFRDPYLDIRFRNENASVGAADAKLAGLEDIQRILDEVGDGKDGFGVLGAQLNDFFKQLQNLSEQTGHAEYDIQVRSSATALVKLFNSYASQLEQVGENAMKDFEQDIKTVNTLLTNIRDLNSSIRKAEIHGDNALELRDERNMLIDQLSGYMKIDVVPKEVDIGGIKVTDLTIRLADVQPPERGMLIDGIYATQLSVPAKNADGTDNKNLLVTLAPLVDKNNRPLDPNAVSQQLGDNDLYGALQAQREFLTESGEFATAADIALDPDAATKRGLKYYQNTLDLLAKQFADAFNAANQGYMQNQDGAYIDANGTQVTFAGEALSANGLTTAQKAELERDDTYVLKDAAGRPILDKDGKKQLDLDRYMNDKGVAKVGFPMFSIKSDGNDTTGINASNISVSQAWSSGNTIVSSFVKPDGMDVGSTDSSNILHMIAIMGTKMDYYAADANTPMFNGTFHEMWNNIGTVLGNDMMTTSTLLDTYYASATQLNGNRDSVSSVDLNDEAMNLMQYSKSYNAACRLMTTLDSVLDKLINGTGMTT